MTNEMHEPTGDSRRNFMKKGALAATALAVGAGATATTGSVAAQEEDEGEVVIPLDDFYPEQEFTVLAEFETATRDNLLENLDPEEEEFDDPSDWDVYAISVEVGGGRLGYLMVEDDEIDASPGDMGTMNETASFRNPNLNLLELDVTIEEDEVDEEDDEVDDEEEEVDDEEEEVDEEEEEIDEEEDEVEDEDDGF